MIGRQVYYLILNATWYNRFKNKTYSNVNNFSEFSSSIIKIFLIYI